MTDNVINMANDLRPTKFSDMIGQPYVRGVGKRLGEGKVSGQGYILSGPRGTGKTTAARIIAKSLNCLNRDKTTGDPCGECKNCDLFETGFYPYTKEVNAASTRGIAEVKNALSTIQDAVPDGYRVYIFDEFQMLTREAFSSLLKVIEEPPANVVFVFATTNPEKIPETILSRSPIINVLPLSDNDIRSVLDKVVDAGMEEDPETWSKITEDDIYHAVMSATGSARQAITTLSGIVFHGVQSTGIKDSTDDIVEMFLSGSVAGVMSQVSAALSEDGVDVISLISSVINAMVDKIIDGSISDNVELHAREVAKLSEVAKELSSSAAPSLVAASIASCVVDPKKIMFAGENAESDTHGSGPSKKTVKKETQHSADRNSRKNGVYRESVDQLYVHPDLSEEDLFYHLLDSDSSRKHLPEKWYEILADPKKSDITQDVHTGEPIIKVKNPDEELRQALQIMFTLHTLRRR